jgi:hypothetical protein
VTCVWKMNSNAFVLDDDASARRTGGARGRGVVGRDANRANRASSFNRVRSCGPSRRDVARVGRLDRAVEKM